MEALGLTEAILWEAEFSSLNLTFDLHRRFIKLFSAPLRWRSPRLVANLMGITIALFSPILPSFVSPNFVPAAIAQTSSCNNVLLKKSSPNSAAVRTLQSNLKSAGYPSIAVDGIFGSNTEAVLKSFQSSSGLVADGIYGSQTCTALTGKIARKATTSNTQSSGGVVNAVQGNQSSPSSGSIFSTLPTTKKGSQGTKVSDLQDILRLVGYDNVPSTGTFGNQTDLAVRDFQRQTGLGVDGVVGPKTASRLELAFNRGERYEIRDNRVSNLPNPSTGNKNYSARYIVVVPSRSNETLATVRQYVPEAQLLNSRRGMFVQAGSSADRYQAESLSYALRSYGVDARVVAP